MKIEHLMTVIIKRITKVNLLDLSKSHPPLYTITANTCYSEN